ncbi:hypothetical protein CJA_2476 [Cellvibrio japonicus Ueda107]|uniref:Uncharacterized protein n=1 Tax=Cellvibrio japonicus (strain Ueda107) TaxID=498211 RepID=B3PKK8_CELJU|nr:hypothetical protein CJA_2476 [Cellvibrio japonicus Ueda107]
MDWNPVADYQAWNRFSPLTPESHVKLAIIKIVFARAIA